MKSILACLFLLFSTFPSAALDIVLEQSLDSDPPAFDPGGEKLEAILEAAAEMWEEIIEDPGTITITWSWDSLGLGLANGFNTSLSAPWAGEINFDNDPTRDWFFDPTPHDHSEFALVRVELENLLPADQALRFGGTPPGCLEVSYAGLAVETEAMGAFDALTSALHEIGHALALSGNLHFDAETQDGDLDVPAILGGGVGFAINGIVGEPFHLEPEGGVISPPLMCGSCATMGRRRLPTATDALAVAAALYAGNGVNGTMFWSELDLPRKAWNGDVSDIWETAEAWIGGAEPGSGDAVYISKPSSLRITQRTEVEKIFLEGPGVDFYIDDILHLRDAEIDSAVLRLDDGLVTVDQIDIQMGFGALSAIGGGGRIEFESMIENDGRIFAGSNLVGDPVLQLIGDPGATIDYDGQNENGELQAILGDLEFTGDQADEFDGVIVIAAGRRITFSEGFGLGADGVMQLNGGTTPDPQGSATVDAPNFEFAGEIIVGGECRIANGGTVFLDGCEVDLLDSDSRLTLGGGTIVAAGANFIGPGRLATDGDLFLLDGAEVGVELQTSGRLVLQRVLAGTATTEVENLDLKPGATLRLTVGDDPDPAVGDRLVVTEEAHLAGRLQVVLDAPAAPPGQRWTVLTHSGERTGSFAEIVGIDLPPGMRIEPLYFSNRVEVVLQSVLSYDNWRAGISFANGADSQADRDPDCDGWSNLEEYFLGTNPLNPASLPVVEPVPFRQGGDLFAAIHISTPLGIFASDAAAFAEYSADLSSWDEMQTTFAGAQIDGSGTRNLVFRSNTAMSAVERHFLRIGVRMAGP